MSDKAIEDLLGLTQIQEGILFESLTATDSCLYNSQIRLDINGSVDRDRLAKSWLILSSKHESLRSYFVWEKISAPVQVIKKNSDQALEYIDISQTVKSKSDLLKHVKLDRKKTFDLTVSPIRLTLFKCNNSQYSLILSSHHILLDGWSNSNLLKELFEVYAKLGKEADLTYDKVVPKLSQFRKEQLKQFERNNQQASKFWQMYLEGIESKDSIATLYGSKSTLEQGKLGTDSNHQIVQVELDKIALKQFASEQSVSISSVFYAAWSLLLSRYQRSNDVLFSTAVTHRPTDLSGASDVLSLAIQTLPFRSKISKNFTVSSFVTDIHQNVATCLGNLDFSLPDIIQRAGFEDSNTLSDSILVVENYPLDEKGLMLDTGLEVSYYEAFEKNHYGLSICVKAFEELSLEIIFDSGAYSTHFVHQMLQGMQNILTEFVKNPHKSLRQISLLSSLEQKTFSQILSKNYESDPKTEFFIEKFEAGVKRFGKQTALSIGRKEISYAQLNHLANVMADYLSESAGPPPKIVIVSLKPGLEFVVSMLAVMKLGATFLPVDAALPDERLANIILQSKAELTLVETRRTCLSNDIPTKFVFPEVAIDEIGTRSTNNPIREICEEEAFYVIFTSGSTGEPKGVEISHRAFSSFCAMYQKLISLGQGDRVFSLTGIAFDVFYAETLIPLIHGAHITIGGEEASIDGKLSLKMLAEQEFKLFQATPSRLKMILMFKDDLEQPISTQYIVVAGEKFPDSLLSTVRDAFTPESKVFNLYGPTEATIYATGKKLNDAEAVTIGENLSNTKLLVVDEFGNLLPPGVLGELYLGGNALATGYFGDAKLTDRYFHELPGYGEQKWYNSRDLARYTLDGEILLSGRVDDQIKVRGYRVELGDIENHIRKHATVKDAVVLAKKDHSNFSRLFAFALPVDPKANTSKLGNDLHEALKAELPNYMQPSQIVWLPEFPVSLNGKVDKQKLLSRISTQLNDIELKASCKTAQDRKPDDVLQKVITIWSKNIGVKAEDIRPESDFYLLGGHSLGASRVAANLHKEFNVRVSVVQVLRSRTPNSQAALIIDLKSANRASATRSPDETKADSEYYPISAQQKSVYLAHQMERDSSYNISGELHITGSLDIDKFTLAATKLVEHYPTLRTVIDHNSDVLRCKVLSPSCIQSDWASELVKIMPLSDYSTQAMSLFVRPFNLEKAPLIRFAIYQGQAQEHIILVDVHHIAADGLSVQVLLKNLWGAYQGQEMTAERFDYQDYATRQVDTNYARQKDFWCKQLTPVIDNIKASSVEQNYEDKDEFVRIFKSLDNQIALQIDSLSSRHSTSTFSVMHALLSGFLALHNNQPGWLLATPVENRIADDGCAVSATAVGMFVNTLPVYQKVEATQSVHNFISNCSEHFMHCLQYQDYPFSLLQRDLFNGAPEQLDLVKTMYVHETSRVNQLAVDDVQIHIAAPATPTSKFDLMITSEEVDKELQWSFDLKQGSNIFSEAVANQLISFIELACATPDAELGLIMRTVMASDKRLNKTDTRSTVAPNAFASVSDHQAHNRIENMQSSISEQRRQQVRCLWAELLNVNTYKIEDNSNFFALGGNSLDANTLVVKCNKLLGSELLLKSLYQHPHFDEFVKLFTDKDKPHSSVQIDTKHFYTSVNLGNLSAAQAQIYYSQLISDDDTQYNIPIVFKVEGILDADRIEQVFNYLIARHDALRISIQEGETAPGFSTALSRYLILEQGDLQSINIEECVRQFIRSFEFKKSPLFRCGLFSQIDGTSLLILDFSHLIIDGASLHIILDEFVQLYRGKVPENDAIQFSSVLNHQGNYQYDTEKKFWRNHFAHGWHHANLPSKPGIARGRSHRFHFSLSPSETLTLQNMAQTLNTSLFNLLLGAVAIFVGQRCQQTRITMTTATENRELPGFGAEVQAMMQSCVGLFANTLALDLDVTNNKDFRTQLAQIAHTVDECKANQSLPFGELIDLLQICRSDNTGSIFNLMYVHDDRKLQTLNVADAILTPVMINSGQSKCDLLITSRYSSEQLEFFIDIDNIIDLSGTELTAQLKEFLKTMTDEKFVTTDFFHKAVEIQKNTSEILTSNRIPQEQTASDQTIEKSTYTQIARTWAELLNIEVIRLDHSIDFFTNGGTSLLAYQFLAKVKRITGVRIKLSEFYKNPTIAAVMERTYLTDNSRSTLPTPLVVENPEPSGLFSFPLTGTQQSIYLADQSDVGVSYNMPLLLEINGEIDETQLQHTIRQLIIRHDSLRLSVARKSGVLHQNIQPARFWREENADIHFSIKRLVKQKPDLEVLVKKFISPFDLNKAPLMRTQLFSYSKDFHYLLLDVHHIACDGASLPTLLSDFNALYYNQPLVEKVYDYADFLSWVSGSIDPIAQKFWLGYFDGNEKRIQLPSQKGFTLSKGSKAQRLEFNLGHTTTQKIYGLKQNSEHSLFTILFTLVATSIALLTKEREVVLGFPAANRFTHPEIPEEIQGDNPLQSVVGLFVNTLALKCRININQNFLQVLASTSDGLMSAMDHQHYPYDALYQARGQRGSDLFDVFFTHNSMHFEQNTQCRMSMKPVKLPATEAKFDLHIQTDCIGEDIQVTFEYRQTAFDDIELFQQKFLKTIDMLVAEPKSTLKLVSIEETLQTQNTNYRNVDRAAVENSASAKLREQLSLIWQDLLEIRSNTLTCESDFFLLGGNSLLASELIHEVKKQCNVQLAVAEVFQNQTLGELVACIRAKAPLIQVLPLKRTEPVAEFTLSENQRGLYSIVQAKQNLGTAFNIPAFYQIKGALDSSRLEYALQQVLQKHDILRTRFINKNGKIIQEILPEIVEQIKYSERADDSVAIQKRIIEFIRPFELNNAPLFRFEVMQLGEQDYLLMTDFHHIIFDGTSSRIFFQDLIGAYDHEILEVAEFQYRDFVVWQQSYLASEQYRESEKYWMDQFRNNIPLLDWKIDHPRKNQKSYDGSSFTLELEEKLADQIMGINRGTGASPFMFLLAALNLYLARLTGQHDFVIGTPVSGRSHPDLNEVMGFFINTMALRTRVDMELTFEQFLQRVKNHTLEAYSHQDYPFLHLLNKLNPERNPGRSPLFDVMLVMQNYKQAKAEDFSLSVEQRDFPFINAKYDILISVNPTDTSMHIIFEYDSHLFSRDSVVKMASEYRQLLINLLETPEKPLSHFDYLSSAERDALSAMLLESSAALDIEFDF